MDQCAHQHPSRSGRRKHPCTHARTQYHSWQGWFAVGFVVVGLLRAVQPLSTLERRAVALGAVPHLRGGGRIVKRAAGKHFAGSLTDELARMASMGDREAKALGSRLGVLDDAAQQQQRQDAAPTTWFDRQHQMALRVLRRRANEDKREKQRRHFEKHGADAASIVRAEEVQREIAGGNWGQIGVYACARECERACARVCQRTQTQGHTNQRRMHKRYR